MAWQFMWSLSLIKRLPSTQLTTLPWLPAMITSALELDHIEARLLIFLNHAALVPPQQASVLVSGLCYTLMLTTHT